MINKEGDELSLSSAMLPADNITVHSITVFFRTPTPSLKLLYMLININICIDKLIPIRLYEVNHRQRNCDFVICDDAFFYK